MLWLWNHKKAMGNLNFSTWIIIYTLRIHFDSNNLSLDVIGFENETESKSMKWLKWITFNVDIKTDNILVY